MNSSVATNQSTVRSYIYAVEDFANYFHRSPERLGPDHIRQYQAYLFRERKLSAGTIEGRTASAAVSFRQDAAPSVSTGSHSVPKHQRRLPTVLDQQEVARLIACASNLMHRAMLMILYATGLRRAEMCHLKISDIDSKRMVIHVRQGKGGCDRDVLLTPKLLETLREYWRWMKPKTYLFPGTVKGWRADVPITEKIVWQAVNEAAKRAAIGKHVSPHTLRHCFAKRGEARCPSSWCGQSLPDFELVSEVECGKFRLLWIEYGHAGIRVDHPFEIRTGLCLEIDVLPEVTQLGFVFARDKESRPRKAHAPFLAANAAHLGQAEVLPFVHRPALLNLTSQMPCGRLGSPPLRMSSMRKVRALGIVSRTARAHLGVICEGQITKVAVGRPSART